MKNFKDKYGYIIGFVIFVVIIPIIMYRLAPVDFISGPQMFVFGFLGFLGLALSIWSLVYMNRVGQGAPLDAFNHEVGGSRTKNLMTDGPYGLCRNPMLLGIYIYYAGICVALPCLQSVAIFFVFALIMHFQVKSEEKRLEADFGAAYLKYKENTPALIPKFKKEEPEQKQAQPQAQEQDQPQTQPQPQAQEQATQPQPQKQEQVQEQDTNPASEETPEQ